MMADVLDLFDAQYAQHTVVVAFLGPKGYTQATLDLN